VARDGIQNPDLYTKRVSKKIFDRWDLPRVSEKVLALISSLSDSCVKYFFAAHVGLSTLFTVDTSASKSLRYCIDYSGSV
jgi:hypothetical protein